MPSTDSMLRKPTVTRTFCLHHKIPDGGQIYPSVPNQRRGRRRTELSSTIWLYAHGRPRRTGGAATSCR